MWQYSPCAFSPDASHGIICKMRGRTRVVWLKAWLELETVPSYGYSFSRFWTTPFSLFGWWTWQRSLTTRFHQIVATRTLRRLQKAVISCQSHACHQYTQSPCLQVPSRFRRRLLLVLEPGLDGAAMLVFAADASLWQGLERTMSRSEQTWAKKLQEGLWRSLSLSVKIWGMNGISRWGDLYCIVLVLLLLGYKFMEEGGKTMPTFSWSSVFCQVLLWCSRLRCSVLKFEGDVSSMRWGLNENFPGDFFWYTLKQKIEVSPVWIY